MINAWIKILLSTILIGMLSCQDHIETIEKDKMVDIIVDLHVAEQLIKRYDMSVQDSIKNLLQKSLLKVHNITQEQLDTNIYIYQYDVEGYKEISKAVVLKLEQLRDQPHN